MAIDMLETSTAGVLASETYAPASPFAETFLLAPEPEDAREPSRASSSGLESPFRSESFDAPGEAPGGPERAEFEALVSGLHEAEFGEALYELAAETAVAAHEQLGENEGVPGEREQLMERYLAQPAAEAEATFVRLAERYAEHDIAPLTEQELDRLFESMRPSFEHLSPGFENLFGGLWNKVKSVAKGAVALAKKGIAAVGRIVPLGWIFDKLKGLIKPLLRRVLQFAIGRLPSPLQPVATQLAKRLFGEAESAPLTEGFMTPEAEDPRAEALAAGDLDGVQREFDARAASLLFARDEAEQEAMVAESATGSPEAEDRFAALDAARERFVREVTEAEAGRDLTAQMENFLPAIMMALRLGLKIVGRQRVVNFLAGHLAGFVAPYVGRPVATQLASAIVSTGMSLVGLEVPTEREGLAGEAVANAVEGTVSRLAEQGEGVFTDQRLLEAAVQEAFTAAAAEAFPPSVIREQFHEVSGRVARPGTWVLAPRQGRRRYRRYTRTLDVTITRQVAAAVQGFGGITLEAFLRSRFGVGAPVTVKAHLYQAVPGTKLSTIARLETGVAGLGPQSVRGWRLFLPLTRHTAGLLFGEPGLGRDVPATYLRSSRTIVVGQRFIVLEPATRRTAPAGPARPSQVNLTLDIPRETARVFVHLNEADTQAVAGSLRRGESVTPVLVLVRKVYVAALRSMLSGQARRHVKIVREAENEGLLGTIGEAILAKVVDKLIDWIGTALAEYFTGRAQEFVTAAANPADGVTMVVTVRHPSLMQVLGRALKGDAVGTGLALTRALLARAEVSLTTVPGFRS